MTDIRVLPERQRQTLIAFANAENPAIDGKWFYVSQVIPFANTSTAVIGALYRRGLLERRDGVNNSHFYAITDTGRNAIR